jgi:hypothetical protein
MIQQIIKKQGVIIDWTGYELDSTGSGPGLVVRFNDYGNKASDCRIFGEGNVS